MSLLYFIPVIFAIGALAYLFDRGSYNFKEFVVFVCLLIILGGAAFLIIKDRIARDKHLMTECMSDGVKEYECMILLKRL